MVVQIDLDAVNIPTLGVAGLTGAASASRYAGGTTNGPPVAVNPFLLGDFVIDQTGRIWVCITAGSPGKWLPVGPTPMLGIMGLTGWV